MYFCERCLDTGEVLSGEDGPSWKHFEPCPECDGPPYGKKRDPEPDGKDSTE